MRRTPALLIGALSLALVGCSSEPDRTPTAQPSASPWAPVPAQLEIGPRDDDVAPRQVLALVPASVEVLTISNFDETRDRFGTSDLTSDSLVSDRSAFAERARADGLLFTQGLFADDASLFWLDHGFTQDDVDWEARFDGPDGPGFVLSFRPEQEMAEVQQAVEDRAGPLGRHARVLPAEHLLVSGIAAEDEPVLANDPRIPPLLEDDIESAYLRTSCVPFNDALGPDAGAEEQEKLLEAQDIRHLDPLGPFALNFLDDIATGRLGPGRDDLHARTDLIDLWPRLNDQPGQPVWSDGFQGLPVADPMTGRVGLQVRNPAAAVNLVLADRLPFAVCNEVTPIEEPTGP